VVVVGVAAEFVQLTLFGEQVDQRIGIVGIFRVFGVRASTKFVDVTKSRKQVGQPRGGVLVAGVSSRAHFLDVPLNSEQVD
jgi:hypothetical protein